MKRQSTRLIELDPNCRAIRLYPTEDSTKDIKTLKTIGISLSKDQAIHLARLLLAATQDWDEVDITGWRFKKREDNTYQVTVTS